MKTITETNSAHEQQRAPGERLKALLIFPLSFYSFADGIMTALSARGYDVTLANHEYPMNMIGKILGNLKIFWPLSAITERVLYRDYVKGKRYDIILIFKGRGISRRVIENSIAPRQK